MFLAALWLTRCAPQLGCHIGTHKTAMDPARYLGPNTGNVLDKIRSGDPVVCAARFQF